MSSCGQFIRKSFYGGLHREEKTAEFTVELREREHAQRLVHGYDGPSVLDVDAFFELRTFAYHMTSVTNLVRIREMRVLQSAEQLLRLSGIALQAQRRTKHAVVPIGDTQVHIRDQRPLIERAIAFDDGWTLARYLLLLNSFTFFWVGDASGPIDRGRKHFSRYSKTEQLIVLRIPMRELFDANKTSSIRFTSVNSGAARMNRGRKLRRGPSTFLNAAEFPFTPGRVIEVVVRDTATLPSSAEWAGAPDSDRWQTL